MRARLLDAPSPQEVEAERVEAQQQRRLVCWMAAERRRWDAEHPGAEAARAV